MTQVHVLPAGEAARDHRLGDCPCQPRRRPRRRDDGTVIDHVHIHNAVEDLLEGLPR